MRRKVHIMASNKNASNGANKKAGKNSGSNGPGTSKLIAVRQRQSEESKDRRERRGSRGSISDQLDNLAIPVPVISWTEMVEAIIEGTLRTGVRVDFAGESQFEYLAPDRLILVSSTAVVFAPHVRTNENIFVMFWQVAKNNFVSTIPGKAGQKQQLMISYIREQLSEEDLGNLSAFVSSEREKFKFIGEEATAWSRASANVSLLEQLSDKNRVEVRFGKTMEDGIVLGFMFDDTRHSTIVVGIGHIGNKHPLAAKTLNGTYLKCSRGQFPEFFDEEKMSQGEMIASAGELLKYLNGGGLEELERQQLMNAMMAACKRLHDARKVHSIHEHQHVGFLGRGGNRPTPKTVATAPRTEVPAAQAPAEPKAPTSGLPQYIASLKSAGIDGAELAELVVAYKASANKAATA